MPVVSITGVARVSMRRRSSSFCLLDRSCSIRAVRMSTSKGFDMNASMFMLMLSRSVLMSSLAVSMMIGTVDVGMCFFIRRHIVRPSITGISISAIIKSGTILVHMLKPVLPLSATKQRYLGLSVSEMKDAI